METIRIYTNDVEQERLRQGSYAETPNRLSLNRHRLRRAKIRQLTVIAIVAAENKDRTIYKECRERIAELTDDSIPTKAKLNGHFDLVDSRRPSRSQRYAFASNRMSREHIMESLNQVHTFPQQEDRAMDDADKDQLS